MRLDRFDREDNPRYRVSAPFHDRSSNNLIHSSINCRLPQTPRTPSTAAAHYFDDIFSRGINRTGSKSLGPKPRIRRSSTSRSIGNRSSYNTSFNGDNAASEGPGPEETEESERRRSEADQHVANFVNDQLTRVNTGDSVAVYEDEFEAQLD